MAACSGEPTTESGGACSHHGSVCGGCKSPTRMRMRSTRLAASAITDRLTKPSRVALSSAPKPGPQLISLPALSASAAACSAEPAQSHDGKVSGSSEGKVSQSDTTNPSYCHVSRSTFVRSVRCAMPGTPLRALMADMTPTSAPSRTSRRHAGKYVSSKSFSLTRALKLNRVRSGPAYAAKWRMTGRSLSTLGGSRLVADTKPMRPLLNATASLPVRVGHSPYVSGTRPQRGSRAMLITDDAPERYSTVRFETYRWNERDSSAMATAASKTSFMSKEAAKPVP